MRNGGRKNQLTPAEGGPLFDDAAGQQLAATFCHYLRPFSCNHWGKKAKMGQPKMQTLCDTLNCGPVASLKSGLSRLRGCAKGSLARGQSSSSAFLRTWKVDSAWVARELIARKLACIAYSVCKSRVALNHNSAHCL